MNYTDYIKYDEIEIENENIEAVFKAYRDKYIKAAMNTIKGMYGNGEARKAKLKALGYDSKFVQDLVNRMI